MRRSLCVLGVVFLAAEGCTRVVPAPAGTPPSTPVPEPTAAPTPRTTRTDLEPELLQLEDRRAYDGQVLESGAASADSPARVRTALAIGRIGDARGAAPLHPLLGDSSDDVRSAAAFAAGILGDPGLTGDLLPLLHDRDAKVAARAAWAIGFLEQPRGQDALIAALAVSEDPARKAAMLRALWRFPTPAAATAARLSAGDANPAIRAAALYALARRPQEASLTALTACLTDDDADTAALCARGIGLLGKPESIAPLSAAVEGPRTPVSIQAMAALTAILEKNPQAERPPTLAPRALALAGDANPNLAVTALALCRFFTQDSDVFRRLSAIATSGTGRRQQVALQSLMAGLGEKSSALADAAIANGDPRVRAAAAEALSFLSQAQAAPRRAALSQDPQVLVRLKLLDGLKTPADIRSNRDLVDRLLADPDAGVRAGALDALGRLEEPSVLPTLREAVEKSYGETAPDVPIAAIGAAETQAPAPEARAVVEAAYRHPSVLVARLGRRSLVRKFGADPSLPEREYDTGRSLGDYAALLAEAKKPWVARVETARGAFQIRLAGAEAPMTVMNFVALARKGYFDGAPIHRVVPNFVVQDGDPTGTGNGGPGYEIRDETNPTPYGTGTVGMALSGPDTGGSQWFATQSPQPHLDGIYTVFGQVTQGLDVLRRIEQWDAIVRITVAEAG
jgi:cyclophilin family peptidyl-prolyl cis-trans isomerase/HEAT repeat protein